MLAPHPSHPLSSTSPSAETEQTMTMTVCSRCLPMRLCGCCRPQPVANHPIRSSSSFAPLLSLSLSLSPARTHTMPPRAPSSPTLHTAHKHPLRLSLERHGMQLCCPLRMPHSHPSSTSAVDSTHTLQSSTATVHSGLRNTPSECCTPLPALPCDTPTSHSHPTGASADSAMVDTPLPSFIFRQRPSFSSPTPRAVTKAMHLLSGLQSPPRDSCMRIGSTDHRSISPHFLLFVSLSLPPLPHVSTIESYQPLASPPRASFHLLSCCTPAIRCN